MCRCWFVKADHEIFLCNSSIHIISRYVAKHILLNDMYWNTISCALILYHHKYCVREKTWIEHLNYKIEFTEKSKTRLMKSWYIASVYKSHMILTTYLHKYMYFQTVKIGSYELLWNVIPLQIMGFHFIKGVNLIFQCIIFFLTPFVK